MAEHDRELQHDDGGAPRRTRLASERTLLAWWRTGLAALAVSLGTGKVVPALTDETRWPYTVVGVVFALFGIGCIAYGHVRHREVDAAIDRGGYAPPSGAVLLGLSLFGAVAGVALVALVIVAD